MRPAELGTRRVTYLGHATVLVELRGVRLLTDPNLDAQLSRLPFLASRTARVGAPAVEIASLPRVDAVLLTHAHADHLSWDTLRALPARTPIIAPPALAAWLRRRGFAGAVPLAAGESATVGRGEAGVTVTAGRATHEGSRYGVDRWRSATNLYLADDGACSCFFAGDTALECGARDLADARLRAHGRALDVALLPISWAPWWRRGLRSGHLTWRDALTLGERLDARWVVPCHWGAFRFPDSGPYDAIGRLCAHVGAYARAERVRIVEPGRSLDPVTGALLPAPSTAACELGRAA